MLTLSSQCQPISISLTALLFNNSFVASTALTLILETFIKVNELNNIILMLEGRFVQDNAAVIN